MSTEPTHHHAQANLQAGILLTALLAILAYAPFNAGPRMSSATYGRRGGGAARGLRHARARSSVSFDDRCDNIRSRRRTNGHVAAYRRDPAFDEADHSEVVVGAICQSALAKPGDPLDAVNPSALGPSIPLAERRSGTHASRE